MADPFAAISSIIESARDITIEAAVSASTRLSETPAEKRPKEISSLLNSRTERDILSGIKCVIALISRGEDGSQYFADVVKNVTLTNARVRALVMIYVQKYARVEPDTALLSINSIQRSLSDKEARSRASSIRALGGVHIPEIGSLMILCIRRTLGDRLPAVRACTALAIGSAFTIEGIDRSLLLLGLKTLLCDDAPEVVSASIKTFANLKHLFEGSMQKKAWGAMHSNYRRFVRILPEMDEWTQCIMIDILVEYSRRFLPKPHYVHEDGTTIPYEGFATPPSNCDFVMDSDLQLFIEALQPISHAVLETVILAAVQALISLGTPKFLVQYGYNTRLIGLILRRGNGIQTSAVLQTISNIARDAPETFERFHTKFYLNSYEEVSVAVLKLRIILHIFNEGNAKPILRELKLCSHAANQEIAKEAVIAIANCCQKSEDWGHRILDWCILRITQEPHSSVTPELITVIRLWMQKQQANPPLRQGVIKTIYKLSEAIQNSQTHLTSEARAAILWVIGEFTDVAANTIGPDIVRSLIPAYSEEAPRVRLEILQLAAKSYLWASINSPHDGLRKSELMLRHILQLARYDPVVRIRDRARMMEALFRTPESANLATLFMQVPKAAPLFTKFHAAKSSMCDSYLTVTPWANPTELPPMSVRLESNPSNEKETRFGSRSFTSKPRSERLGAIQPIARREGPRDNTLQSLDDFFGNDDVESAENSDVSDSSELVSDSSRSRSIGSETSSRDYASSNEELSDEA